MNRWEQTKRYGVPTPSAVHDATDVFCGACMYRSVRVYSVAVHVCTAPRTVVTTQTWYSREQTYPLCMEKNAHNDCIDYMPCAVCATLPTLTWPKRIWRWFTRGEMTDQCHHEIVWEDTHE